MAVGIPRYGKEDVGRLGQNQVAGLGQVAVQFFLLDMEGGKDFFHPV